MAHVYNKPEEFKNDMIDGFVAAYDRYVQRVPDTSGVMRRGGPRNGKVSVIIGGGSGHYPAFCGVVGPGFADGAVIGDIFTSPSTEQAYRTARALDGGAGVLFSFGNYAGDVMNFGAAQDRLRADGIDCRTVLVTDDIASARIEEAHKRRGVAGDFTVFKVAGAAADRGDDIDTVERWARAADAATFSFGVAFAGCTFPGKNEPLFTVAPGTMDLGLGIHGEPGVRTVDWMPASALAKTLLDPILAERPAGATRAAVILNGLGGTKYEELFVLWKTLAVLLADARIEVVLPEIGELVTSLDMAGCSLTLMWLDTDGADGLEELWTAPADTPGFRRGAITELHEYAHREISHAIASTAAPEEAGEESLAAAMLVKKAIAAMLEVVLENEDELGRIDAVAGDGDHGVGMARGLRAANEAAIHSTGGVATVLADAGAAWADKAGGTSGVLWGAILTATGAELGNQYRPTAENVGSAVTAGAAALQRLGKCRLGDKTMYDALQPFAVTLNENLAAGGDLISAWTAAVGVCAEKAAATADLVPQLGRARPLAERSVGTPDAGATSMALCMRAIGEVLK